MRWAALYVLTVAFFAFYWREVLPLGLALIDTEYTVVGGLLVYVPALALLWIALGMLLRMSGFIHTPRG